MMSISTEEKDKSMLIEENPYLPMPVRVKRTVIESEDRSLKTLDLEFINPEDKEKFNFMPGQFCELSVFGRGEAPFGIASSPDEKDFIRFTINKVGIVTEALHYMEEGDELGIRGPLGNYYPVELFKNKNILIISGGFAFTTLRSLTRYLLLNRDNWEDITLIYGARTPGMMLYKDELQELEKRKDIKVYLTIDREAEGWNGLVGLVPQIVEEKVQGPKETYAVVCGPPIMIKFTLLSLNKLGFTPESIYLSLERRMKCGIGKCGRCNIGRFYVCKDGPIFSYAQLKELHFM